MTELADLMVGGQVLRITRWGEPILHAPTVPVTDFDSEFHTLIRDMFATMTAADGVGLAAPQVGDNRSFFIFCCPGADDHVCAGAVINPVIHLPDGKDRQLVSDEEGCLSLPGSYSPLARPNRAICQGLDHNGNPLQIIGTGLLARCLQHETDHLSGMVFGDRLSDRARKRLYADHEESAYRYPDDWPISPKGEFDPTR